MPGNNSGSASGSQNRLSKEASPYLRLHAKNPVDWYPWGDEAFATAKRLDRPVFLSIGYATCHWCHVMMRESFADPAIAKLLNDTFVCIKVDREERPDIDAIYMEAAMRLSGMGGWPLTVVATPDAEPFFAATYLPPRTMGTTRGLEDLIPRIAHLWTGDRTVLVSTARSVTGSIRGGASGIGIAEPTPALLSRGFEELRSGFDDVSGGFGTSPKFPVPHTLMFLLRYWKRHREAAALAMVEKTLSAMAAGGIFDQLGGGFHRYATDRAWSVPHFEKMLYDQALAVLAYLEAYQATGRRDFQEAAVSCLEYVLRELQVPEGGFFAAQDAESGGEEGAYYLWTRSAIENLLGREESARFFSVYHVTTSGNYQDPVTGRRTGKNILRVSASFEEAARDLGIPSAVLAGSIASSKKILLGERGSRIRPAFDDQILTDWNGLAIAAFARAGAVLGDERYLDAARRCRRFVSASQRNPSGGLFHRYSGGEPGIPGLGSDYAAFCYGLLELYETTFDQGCLASAIDLESYFSDHFRDNDRGLYFTTSSDETGLIARPIDIDDAAMPSTNSIALSNLVRLSLLTGDPVYETRAWDLARSFAARARLAPSRYTHFLSDLDFLLGPSTELVIAGPSGDPSVVSMLAEYRARFLPSCTVHLKTAPGGEGVVRPAPFLREYGTVGGKPTAYVCRARTCSPPVTDPASLPDLLDPGFERRI